MIARMETYLVQQRMKELERRRQFSRLRNELNCVQLELTISVMYSIIVRMNGCLPGAAAYDTAGAATTVFTTVNRIGFHLIRIHKTIFQGGRVLRLVFYLVRRHKKRGQHMRLLEQQQVLVQKQEDLVWRRPQRR